MPGADPGRFVDQLPFDPAVSVQPAGLRINGSLALGVVRRCGRLFLLVFGSRPGIKHALLQLLGAAARAG